MPHGRITITSSATSPQPTAGSIPPPAAGSQRLPTGLRTQLFCPGDFNAESSAPFVLFTPDFVPWRDAAGGVTKDRIVVKGFVFAPLAGSTTLFDVVLAPDSPAIPADETNAHTVLEVGTNEEGFRSLTLMVLLKSLH